MAKIYIETYGCQMNVSDSEVVAALLRLHGYDLCTNAQEADIILINTCAVRENAENRVLGRLQNLAALRNNQGHTPILGILGCMATHLRKQLLDQGVGARIVVGPDSYRQLPTLLQNALAGEKVTSLELSREETYAEILPYRYATPGVSAFVSIMRGCNNMCSFCVVPYTRGRERSRSLESIILEVTQVQDAGYKEITLLGQNVDSYAYATPNGPINFATLLAKIAELFPALRIRFSTSHPKDMTRQVVETMACHHNICHHIHLPVQSGATRLLKAMRRGYSREDYLEQVEMIRKLLPDCALSTDIIAGFCGETTEEFEQTLSLMDEVKFDSAFMFKYSNREGTYASKHMPDDVPEEEKTRRLQAIIELQQQHSLARHQAEIGQVQQVLIEGPSRKNKNHLAARTSGNKIVVLPRGRAGIGQYTNVRITDCTSATLIGQEID